MFWAAAALILIGAVLLASAAVWQIGRLMRSLRKRARSGGRRLHLTAPPPSVTSDRKEESPHQSGVAPKGSPAKATALATGTAAGREGRSEPAAADQPEPDLGRLLQRLRGAAERLEDLTAAGDAAADAAPESSLKESPYDVEYVFKASRL
jgi:hypothetical protein